ncbi:heat shock protein 67B3-like [Anthonomus grandis grandis]|uniref:heat shock protein 67B3-like n=1 Tax=Anthonomus grandis grandis TaxID=2921223 RepID=UPI002165DE33|nr:heat shock protein 67B3-like [Anthonomus grandis grandis]
MALLPYLFDDDLFRHRKLSQWIDSDELLGWPAILPNRSSQHLRDLRNSLAHYDQGTAISDKKNHFEAHIDVQQFRPEEISVKLMDDNSIKVEAKHEEQQDDHGFVSRHFVRRYLLPKDCDTTKIESTLSSDGILEISVPKKLKEDDVDGQEIPIIHVGRPLMHIKKPHLWPSRRGDRKRKLSCSN